MKDHLALELARGTYAAGEQVSGTVRVLEAAKGRELTLALEYRDWTSDYRAVNRSVALPGPLHVGDLEDGASFPFSVRLPEDALPEQYGRFGAASWGVHAQLERSGPDFHAWHQFELGQRVIP